MVSKIPNLTQFVFTISVFSFFSISSENAYAIKDRADERKIKDPIVNTEIFNKS